MRAKLIAVFVTLLVLTSALVGVLTTVALNDFLISRHDSQLAAVLTRAQASSGHPPGGNQSGRYDGQPKPKGPDFLLGPGLGDSTIGAIVQNGQIEAKIVVADQGTSVLLSEEEAAPLKNLTPNGVPITLDIPHLGSYRVAAVTLQDGDVLIAGIPMSGVTETVWQLAGVVSIVSALGIGAAALLGAWIVTRTLRPLDRVAATATKVSELELDKGTVTLVERVPSEFTSANTEVGKVGLALNRLLDNVSAALSARHASETRVRHFVADASHELRTPLAAIRGYAELTRRSKDQVPEDVAHAMSRVESESARMTTLVEDLLLLARLDEGREQAETEVDLSRLIVDVVSDAQIAGPRQRWSLDLPPEPVTVIGDNAQLHQVFANLLANARTHTPPGTLVSVGLRPVQGGAAVTITDNGPGIPQELMPEIFERFTRGDSSRSRAAGSTGLGLAIVSAVVAAHRGTVTVTSRPGETVFTVRLPGS